MRLWIVALSALLLFGCNQQALLEKFSTPADQTLARSYISELQAGKFDSIERDIDPRLKSPSLHQTLVRMAGLLPAGPPTSVKVVGANTVVSPAGRMVNTTFEYQWPGKWLLCNVAVQKSATAQTIVGFHVTPEAASLTDRFRFTLTGKSATQYAILGGAVLALGLTLVSLVACIRTRGLRRKWLWILFILFGFGAVSVNWATGAVNFQPIYVSLFSAGAFAPLYGPWTISMSLPVGAMVFLLRRRKLQAIADPAEPF